MNATSIRSKATAQEYARRIDWDVAWAWVLGFGLVAYLGLKGGGFDPLVHDQVGIAVWWILLLGGLVGVLPRARLGAPAWAALGLLVAFAAWTGLSLIWTEGSEGTAAELALVVTYVGVLALTLFSRDRRRPRHLIAAVAAGLTLVALVGLLSRLHPAWFPEADQTARFLEDSERLSYPLNYWNGLAALVAIGLPVVLHVATGARTILVRALGAAALPALILTLFLTLSRGGIATAAIALAAYLAFTGDRLPRALTLLIAGAGGAILVAATLARDALQEGLANSTAHQQGDTVLLMTIVVCVLVGLGQAAFSYLLLEKRRPRWTEISHRGALIATGVGALVALIAIAAFDVPGRASNGWDEFREGGGPGTGTERLGSVAGQNRYQFWSAAVRENATAPLIGTGSNSFEFWWTRDGDSDETVRDAHSLYMQTLGELGIIGFAILILFVAGVLAAGISAALRADAGERALLAAALAGCLAFFLTAAIDWTWQIPVLPVAMLLLASVLVSARPASGPADEAPGVVARVGVALVALASIVAIAIPLAATSLLRQSESDGRAGDLGGALEAARSAENVEGGFAGPRLQQALVLEELGELDRAAAAARAATERESTNWRNWLVLSRIEAERGRASASVQAYNEAESLNPNFSLFNR
jgi:hypothetical protein